MVGTESDAHWFTTAEVTFKCKPSFRMDLYCMCWASIYACAASCALTIDYFYQTVLVLFNGIGRAAFQAKSSVAVNTKDRDVKSGWKRVYIDSGKGVPYST